MARLLAASLPSPQDARTPRPAQVRVPRAGGVDSALRRRYHRDREHSSASFPPAKGSRHVLRVIRELALLEPRGKKTRIASALDYLDRMTHRRYVVFLVSDFIGDGYKRALTIANKRHDIVAVVVTDPREVSLPRAGLVEIQDPESGGRFLLDTSHRDARALYKQAWLDFSRQRAEVLRQAGVDAIHISTDRSYVEPIVRLFLMRKKRSR